MLTVNLVCAGIMSFWAGILNEENASSLLSGYNTMSDEKKKNVDFKAIVGLYKKVFYGISIAFVINGILSHFFPNDQLWGSILMLIFCWGMLPLFFLGKKHDPNTYSKWQYAINYFVLGLLFFGGLILSILIYTSEGDLLIK